MLMPKFILLKKLTDTIEIDAPDEVQAEEDAETAAKLMEKDWLNHPEIDYKEFYEDIEFKVEDVEEQVE